jgi:hypothetical protein
MAGIPNLRPVVLTNRETRRFSCGLIALKGELGGRILSRLAAHPPELHRVVAPSFDVLGWLESASISRKVA